MQQMPSEDDKAWVRKVQEKTPEENTTNLLP
jgi:hypothetical protein